MKILGYDMAEWVANFRLAGPWTLLKYPSDGTEHKVGDLDYSNEDYQNYNILMNGFLKSNEGVSYNAHKNQAISKLMEMYDINSATANKILQKSNMKALIKTWGYIPTDKKLYNNIYTLFINYVGEVNSMYNDYLDQKAAENGDMEYLAAKNWEHIISMLSTNPDIKRFLLQRKGLDKYVHYWFVEDFGRESSESPEDLEWLADHMLNFDNYFYSR